uniref:Uncharacterized protein n=1 Tax=Ditylenchus dipsaci TaxID=166011 RepID=A0A915EGF4_9BILA
MGPEDELDQQQIISAVEEFLQSCLSYLPTHENLSTRVFRPRIFHWIELSGKLAMLSKAYELSSRCRR